MFIKIFILMSVNELLNKIGDSGPVVDRTSLHRPGDGVKKTCFAHTVAMY